MEPKWAGNSVQIWASILPIAAGIGVVVLEHFYPGMFGPEIKGAAIAAVLGGLAGIGLRFKTDRPVTLRRQP
jgi:hypothetical protein